MRFLAISNRQVWRVKPSGLECFIVSLMLTIDGLRLIIGKTKKPPLDENPFGGFFWPAKLFSSNRGCRKYLRGEFFAPKGKKEGLAKPLFSIHFFGFLGGVVKM